MIHIRLRWNDPVVGPQERLLDQSPITIGSDAGNTVVLNDPSVAPLHATIEQVGDQYMIASHSDRDGVRLNGQLIQRAVVLNGAVLQVGPVNLTAWVTRRAGAEAQKDPTQIAQRALDDAARVVRQATNDATVIAVRPSDEATVLRQRPSEQATVLAVRDADPIMQVSPVLTIEAPAPVTPKQPPAEPDWPPAPFAKQLVAVKAIEALGIPVSTVQYATVGAGLGSFVWADLLRISGIKAADIVALGLDPVPYAHYKLLTRNSQIPDHERLRSNSESTPDNVWGWPGYALREIWGDFRRGNIGRSWSTFWQIFGEPTLTDTWTPRIGDMFRAVDREAKRIGWESIFRYGRVRAIRKTDDGRYAIAYSRRSPNGRDDDAPHAVLIAQHVHLATGYPAIQFLKDLQQYRAASGDFTSVVNAYEDHDHIYEHLRRHGGLVMVRGRGIVASRILQRIYEERAHNPHIGIIHLLRSPSSQGHRYGRSQREVINHVEFQPFNWPRGCWTGPQRKQLERAGPEERKRLLEAWGGTTTAKRRDWVDITKQGLREGWYQIAFGDVERVERNGAGELVTVVKAKGQVGGELHYAADFIIDATGLDAKVKVNPLLRDMVDHYNLALNPLERLNVENDFEVTGMANGNGRMYAAGAMTLGGPNAGVDTFLGLQYAAWRSVDSLSRARAAGIHYVNGVRSIVEWLKWAGGIQP